MKCPSLNVSLLPPCLQTKPILPSSGCGASFSGITSFPSACTTGAAALQISHTRIAVALSCRSEADPAVSECFFGLPPPLVRPLRIMSSSARHRASPHLTAVPPVLGGRMTESSFDLQPTHSPIGGVHSATQRQGGAELGGSVCEVVDAIF